MVLTDISLKVGSQVGWLLLVVTRVVTGEAVRETTWSQ